MGAGKSTIGKHLAARLNVEQCSMDEKRWNYYNEIGYDEELAEFKRATEGFWGVYQYWKPFEAYAVERLLSENKNKACVIDFGAGHSVYEDSTLFQKVRHPSNSQLAKFTVYTQNQTPNETCRKILAILNLG